MNAKIQNKISFLLVNNLRNTVTKDHGIKSHIEQKFTSHNAVAQVRDALDAVLIDMKLKGEAVVVNISFGIYHVYVNTPRTKTLICKVKMIGDDATITFVEIK